MNHKSYEDQIRSTLESDFISKSIFEIGDSTPVFSRMGKIFEPKGSKIDWGKVPESIQAYESDENQFNAACLEFFAMIVQKFSLDGSLIYVGDGNTDFAISCSVEKMKTVLGVLLEVPQHHYLIGENFDWCFCFSFEGDMSFGFNPKRPK